MDRIELAREYERQLAKAEFEKRAFYLPDDEPYTHWDAWHDRQATEERLRRQLNPYEGVSDETLRQPVHHDPRVGAAAGGLLGLVLGAGAGAATRSPWGPLVGSLGGAALGGLAGHTLHPKGVNREETLGRRQELVKRLQMQTAAKRHGIDLSLQDLNR